MGCDGEPRINLYGLTWRFVEYILGKCSAYCFSLLMKELKYLMSFVEVHSKGLWEKNSMYTLISIQTIGSHFHHR